MNELVQRVVQQAGIPEDTAQQAINAVLGFLKERLPGPVATELENVMNGEGGGQSGLGEAAKSVFGMLRKE
jgi:uncharacterized protein (DUF2267 family)